MSNRSLVSAKFCMLRWSTLGKCDRPVFRFFRLIIADHCIFAIFVAVAFHERPGSLRNLWFLSLHHFLLPPLTGSRARTRLHPSSLVSRRGNHEWMVRTDEYESPSFVEPFVILDVVLGRSNLFLFEILLSKLWTLGQVCEPTGE